LRFASTGKKRLKLTAMLSSIARLLLVLFVSGFFSSAVAQSASTKPTLLKRVEPGLEDAVKWEWHVAPSDEKNWGLPAPEPPPTPTPTPPPAATALQPPETRPALYEVKHGDALILIGKRFGTSVAQLKAFNGLKDDTIRVGQKLKIPTLTEISAMPPPVKKSKPTSTPGPKANSDAAIELERLRLQIFLDREQFSAGPIVGYPGSSLTRILQIYQTTHEDAKDDASLAAKAQAAVANVFTLYKLKREDFRFIAPPTAETADVKPTPVSSHARPRKPIVRPPAITPITLTYTQLTALPMLAYRSPWEFVAERFHCQESYLRTLNDKLPAVPGIGAEFRVPNVIPFEIERAFDEPLQPQADPKNPVIAAVIGLSQLNIYQSGALVAVLPLSPARPGLHGRNSWTILDAIPRPRLATSQIERQEPIRKPAFSYAGPTPEPTATPSNTVPHPEEYLAAGPKNPVGILWINLAKSKSTEPLPYGLHGTSIPDQMNVEQSIGGLRLTNWDIARAVRRLPIGTPLEWK
jgi:lipoprotein-anchoring transpeptidase ErfK/SrfK